jgi:DNA polymerase elongation subunit (family B)|tara:strand:+ start:607 stop:753 length:147 start_codon:yes stop_codon:yes gene_type:complete
MKKCEVKKETMEEIIEVILNCQLKEGEAVKYAMQVIRERDREYQREGN